MDILQKYLKKKQILTSLVFISEDGKSQLLSEYLLQEKIQRYNKPYESYLKDVQDR